MSRSDTPDTPSVLRPWRAILIALLLTPFNALWLVQMEMTQRAGQVPGASTGPYPTTFSLFANVICLLVALIALNGIIRKIKPRWALAPAELMIAYFMLSISSALTATDFYSVLVPMIGHVQQYANSVNMWDRLVLPLIPDWMKVSDPGALKDWYIGRVNPWQWRYLAAWAAPLIIWSGFTVALLMTMLALNVLVRKQWTQSEKLSYPVITLPLELTENTGAFFRNRVMWAGFTIAAAISLINGFAVLNPTIPMIPIKAQGINHLFPGPPWNAMGWTVVSFYPFAIGLSFLLPADLLFSCWFFWFMWKAQLVLSSYFGWIGVNPQFPYIMQQQLGAYLVLGLIAIWGARHHLSRVLWLAWKNEDGGDNCGFFTYRRAVVVAVVGITVCCALFTALGLPWWVSLAAFIIYFVVAVSITRMRAELGPPAHDLHYAGPDTLFTVAFGSAAFSPQQLTALSYFYWFNRAYRNLPMPHMLEGMKVAERTKLPLNAINAAMIVAIIAGAGIGIVATWAFGYWRGAETGMATYFVGFGREAFDIRLSTWLRTPTGTDVPALLAVGFGALVTVLLNVGRMACSWWPFHPLGLAISGSYSVNMIWLPMIIAWTAKVIILRFGGLRLYRRALPFFLGLILGDYLFGCGWPLVGWILNITTYSFQQ